jgi:calcineurin-like phosphoesterase
MARFSAVVGSHTHVPTADHQVLVKGTAYITDAGMCGDYDSVIGFQKEVSVPNFLNKIRGEKMKPAEGEGTVCGVAIDIDDKTGLARKIQPIRVGGKLSEIMPN